MNAVQQRVAAINARATRATENELKWHREGHITDKERDDRMWYWRVLADIERGIEREQAKRQAR